jgi:hypothetical protein
MVGIEILTALCIETVLSVELRIDPFALISAAILVGLIG